VVDKATSMMDDIRKHQGNIKTIEKLLKDISGDHTEMLKEISSAKDALTSMTHKMLGEKKQGIYRKPDVLNSLIRNAGYLLDDSHTPINANQMYALNQLSSAVDEFEKELDDFNSTTIPLLKKYVEEKSISLFK